MSTSLVRTGRLTWHWSVMGRHVQTDGFAITKGRAERKIAKWTRREERARELDTKWRER